MKTFLELLNEEYEILESKIRTSDLAPIETAIDNGDEFVIMSAWRGEESPENKANDKKLQSMLNSAGYDFILTVGVGQEEDEEGNIVQNEEEGVFVLGMDKKAGMKIARKFDQDFIVYGVNGIAYLIDTKSGSKEKLGKFKPNQKGDFYTALRRSKGKTFVFK